MHVWWCNQSRDWGQDLQDGVIRASDQMERLTYRKTLGEVRKGDVIVHYRKPHVVAISRALEDGKYKDKLPKGYGSGWEVKAEYFLLDPPIHRNEFAGEVSQFSEKHYAINPNSHVKQGYFLRFDKRGLNVLIKHISKRPTWL